MAQQTQEYTFDVFLSHNRADKPRVRQIAVKLRDEGLEVWFDDWIIRPGDDIYMAIERGLEASRTLILCMSKAAFGSGWVQLERTTSIFRDPTNEQRRFAGLLLEDCHIPDTIKRLKYIDARASGDAFLPALIGACRPEETPAPDGYVVASYTRDAMAQQTQEYAYDVFLSYSSKDKKWVRGWLLQHLEEAGLKVCIDFRDFQVGPPAIVNMENAILTSRRTILVFTPDWVASEWTGFEALLLQTSDPAGIRGTLIPIMLKACELPPRLGMSTYADFRNSDEWDFQFARVLQAVRDGKPEGSSAPDGPSPRTPKVSTSHLPNTGPHLFGRDAMLEDLDGAWDDEKTNVFALVAGGGVGKSALVNHWLAAMGKDDYRGARRVYGHSFYSQGTSDGTASADAFFAEALAWFGDPDPTKGSAWARGERLAELVRAERTLLILDGMEPLQFPPGQNAGRVTDPGLQALLRGLAALNPGLCVVTTREHVADLDRFAPAGAAQKDLEDLPNEAGANLLVQLGARGPLAEMKKASQEFGNHALALTLLGTYLVKARQGDIRRRTEISLVDADTMHGGHARRVMRSYEKWFTEHRREAELAIVRMLGLFNRPAEAGCITALRGGKPIADLTAGLADISEADWNIALSNLREAGLLAKEDEENRGTLDAHPLVREHFAERLEKGYPKAWRTGHGRLYEYLKGAGCKKKLPVTAEEMAPLYTAVLHGCAAGRHQEALDDVYLRRIQRSENFSSSYSAHQLGAFGADLYALSSFFEETWENVVSCVDRRHQAYILGHAGYCLHALGRLREALKPKLAAFELLKELSDWVEAAFAAGRLVDAHLYLGDISQSLECAEEGIRLAGSVSNNYARVYTRGRMAMVLQAQGQFEEAERVLLEAEGLQKCVERENPFLRAFTGFVYCELLLDRGRIDDLDRRANGICASALGTGTERSVDRGLAKLVLGQLGLLRARRAGSKELNSPRSDLDLALSILREGKIGDVLPEALLAQAALYTYSRDLDRARAALKEAMDIATREQAGHMKLFVTDCHLGCARLALAEKKPDVACRELAKARALIEETGYHRRDAELTELEKRGRESFSR